MVERLLNWDGTTQNSVFLPDHVPYSLIERHQRLLHVGKRSTDTFSKPLEVIEIPEVTRDELVEICSRIRDNKVPSLNGAPNRAFKLAMKSIPGMYPKLCEENMSMMTFAAVHKWQKQVRLPPGPHCLRRCPIRIRIGPACASN